MNDGLQILTERLFSAGWLLVSQLRCGQRIDDGGELYRRACGWVNQARGALEQAEFSPASRDHMLYTFCALLDEAVLNRGVEDDGYLRWSRDPLQVHFFGTLNGGEALWERLRGLLREPQADPVVLTCYYRTLQLGFVGHYRDRHDERREELVSALAARVPPFSLAQDAPLVVRAASANPRRWWWLCWPGGVAMLILVWLLLDARLAASLQAVTGAG